MPRRPRVFVDGATYHVYCRTGRSEPVFRQPEESREFIGILAEIKRQDHLAVLAWCLMPSHYHIVVRTGTVPLWRSMRLVQGRFAKSYNRRRAVCGSVWQGRYKAKLIVGERHLQQAIVYVHLNPMAAKLAKSPGAFRWSGHREIESERADGLLDVDEMLAAFGGTRLDARGSYMQAVRGAGAAPWHFRAPGRLPWWTSSRDEGEIELPSERPRLDALGATSSSPPSARIEEVFAAAATLLGTTREELRAPRFGREQTRVREALALVAGEGFGFRVKDLARQFGRTSAVVSRWGTTAAQRRQKDAAFRARVEALATGLDAAFPRELPLADEAILGGGATFVD
jgi:REP element-mobilizing transposase RayT